MYLESRSVTGQLQIVKRGVIKPTFQFTLLGMKLGKELYLLTEIGLGYKGVLILGIGYNF